MLARKIYEDQEHELHYYAHALLECVEFTNGQTKIKILDEAEFDHQYNGWVVFKTPNYPDAETPFYISVRIYYDAELGGSGVQWEFTNIREPVQLSDQGQIISRLKHNCPSMRDLALVEAFPNCYYQECLGQYLIIIDIPAHGIANNIDYEYWDIPPNYTNCKYGSAKGHTRLTMRMDDFLAVSVRYHGGETAWEGAIKFLKTALSPLFDEAFSSF